MFNKKIIFIVFLLIIAIGTVSATDLNSTDDTADEDMVLEKVSSSDLTFSTDLKMTENDSVSSGDDVLGDVQTQGDYLNTHIVSGNSFEDIQNAVSNADKGDTIQLSGTYSGSSPIKIYQDNLIIQGSATLDGKKTSGIFNVNADNITFKNLVLLNSGDCAIKYERGSFNVIKSTFKDCSGQKGAAIKGGYAYDCIFTNCRANEYGVLLGTHAVNCTFTDCFAKYGILYDSDVYDSSFIGCLCSNGAVVEDGTVDGCIFENCGYDLGGVVDDGDVYNSVFKNCDERTVKYSDATNCTFINCNRAFFDMQNGYKAVNSTFIDCGDEAVSNAIAMYCIFKGNSKPASNAKVYRHCRIVLSQTGTYYGDKKITVGVIDTDSNTALSDIDLKITFNNQNSARITTNSKGIATYDMSFSPGIYSAKAIIYDNNFIDCKEESINNIVIDKAPATLSPIGLSTTYASGKYFQIKLSNSENGNGISGVKLALKVYTGNKYETSYATTNSLGVAQYDCSALSVGNHKIAVSIQDTSKCSASAKTSNIKINKASYKITAPKTVSILKKSRTFKVTVKNKASLKAVKGVKVTVKVYTGKKYKKFTKNTNAKGEISINTKSFSKGLHKVTITINANSNFNKASSKSSISIVKSKIKTYLSDYGRIEWHYASTGLNDGVIIYPKLTDSKGKILHKKVSVTTSGGDTVTGYTGNGIFLGNNFDHNFIPINRGGYAIVKFAEDNTYCASTFKINF